MIMKNDLKTKKKTVKKKIVTRKRLKLNQKVKKRRKTVRAMFCFYYCVSWSG